MAYRRVNTVQLVAFILTCIVLITTVLCDEASEDTAMADLKKMINQEAMRLEQRDMCESNVTEEAAAAAATTMRSTIKKCPREFDSIMCWPETEAGREIKLPCPTWFIGMESAESSDVATRKCMLDGTWFTSNKNKSYSDYYKCLNPRTKRLLTSHLPILKTIGKIGCFLSFGSLIFAILLLGVLKRLHCPRNILHINLFASFLLFSFLNLIKEVMFVSSVGFKWDVIQENNSISMNPNVSHWECKTLISFYRYAESSNHVMVFCEALYLNTLISVATFSENNHYKLYVIAGWVVPLFWIVPLTVLLGVATDQRNSCWNTESTMTYIQVVPQVALIFANFFLFINILRILTNKLRENNNHASDSRQNRYKKLAKSTLILLPLFSIYYIAFSVWQPFVRGKLPIEFELSRLYFEIICSSFQGLAISLIYCFFNSEVRMEALKQLERLISQHYPSASLTCLSNLTHNRDRAYSNVSMGRVNSNNVLSSNNVNNNSRKESKANSNNNNHHHRLTMKSIDTNNNYSSASHRDLEDDEYTTNGAEVNGQTNGSILAMASTTGDSIVPNHDDSNQEQNEKKKKSGGVFSFSFRKTRFADSENADGAAVSSSCPGLAKTTESNGSPETIKLLENKVRI